MEHHVPLIATLAWGLGLALLFGFVASRLKVPALVGYLVAGIAIAPTTPGFVGDEQLSTQLSEVGVMLLMFGVGLHFSLADLMRVKKIAVPGAIAQMGLATILGMGVATLWGWSFSAAFILGLSLSCASTVVLLKGLQAHGSLESGEGQVAVGWLVVEDIVTVFLLVLLPSIAGALVSDKALDLSVGWDVLHALILMAGFVVLMLVIGRRVLPWILMRAVQTGSHEIFTLCVIAIAIGIAFAASEIFNVSFALGAFFAGMVMRESEYAHRAAQDTLPLQDAFSVIFFLGVGMLFDPMILVQEPLKVLCVVSIIMIGKSAVALGLVRVLGYSWRYALTIAAALAQVGEFSFILAGLGLNLGLLPKDGMTLILAGAIISIALNPLLFMLVEPILKKISPARPLPDPVVVSSHNHAKTKGPVIIVGAGTMGRNLHESLTDKGIPNFVVEKNVSLLTEEEQMRNFVLGDATHANILERVFIEKAELVILTLDDALGERKIIEEIHKLNPDVRVIALLSKDGDRDFFKDTSGELIPNIQCLDVRKEIAKNVLYYSVGYYRRK
ncbi:MAG: cation:proton antiporter [Burkholderiaceae bacterium]|nr:cation:proton antiporter [Burkholderiaceae bacterium]